MSDAQEALNWALVLWLVLATIAVILLGHRTKQLQAEIDQLRGIVTSIRSVKLTGPVGGGGVTGVKVFEAGPGSLRQLWPKPEETEPPANT